ncbi:HhH-GPD family protein [Chloroherpeton thalassium ATCC 35110]|uniref:HhH-GPD family protein n=1 Tax=Chloroherpeton thalassium (strain ATCC 35110 / GB-78) TaxID=517418 RepID=B3QZA3_CHLT3|nr:base excision DNA repair protein [Chloroherpeton thalassium]ACF13796.1 HhH-GPD family protein [Chloroherpeton thalassium ATCC 35110]
MITQKIHELTRQLESIYGEPAARREEAEGSNCFQSTLLDELVGTILSQNTNDRNSSRAFASLKSEFPEWAILLDAPVAEIAKSIEIGGLANQKAQRIKAILQELVRTQGALSLDFLADFSDKAVLEFLTSFKGVGVKTAGCVLLFGLGRDVCPVDTHIHRILNRLGIFSTKHADETFAELQPHIPTGKAYSLHVNLIRHGKRVCCARKPNCQTCMLAEDCEFARASD